MWLGVRSAGLLLALGSLLPLGACVVDDTPPSGDVKFTWLFDHQACLQASVATVSIRILDIDGSTVVNDTVACSLDGVTYSQMNDGDYSYQLQGLASDGVLLYTAGAPFTVQTGANDTDVNLTPAQ